MRSVWLALDEDSSGHISVGEFGSFMRLARWMARRSHSESSYSES